MQQEKLDSIHSNGWHVKERAVDLDTEDECVSEASEHGESQPFFFHVQADGLLHEEGREVEKEAS